MTHTDTHSGAEQSKAQQFGAPYVFLVRNAAERERAAPSLRISLALE